MRRITRAETLPDHPLRVAHVITRLIVGGAQENTITSVLGLRANPGLQLHLISGPTTGPEGTLEPVVAAVPGLLSIVPPLVRPIRPILDWSALRTLTRIFRSARPHIVHTHSGKAGILGRLAAHWAGVPIIIHSIHGPSFGDFQGPIANLLFTFLERSVGRLTTHFIAVAQAMADQYLSAGIGRREQYTRIWSGFDLEPFLSARNYLEVRQKWGIQPAEFVVGKVARFFPLKGHDDLFAAAPELVRQCPTIKFLLVGDGILRPAFEQRAKKLGLARHFVFTGLVSPAAIPELIGITDVLVHLSLREGLARALPQALAAGKPVVAYNCAGAPEVCWPGQTGFLVAPGDIDHLCRSLLELSANPDLRRRLGQRGQVFVRESFSIQKMVDDQHALYLELANQHLARRRLRPTRGWREPTSIPFLMPFFYASLSRFLETGVRESSDRQKLDSNRSKISFQGI